MYITIHYNKSLTCSNAVGQTKPRSTRWNITINYNRYMWKYDDSRLAWSLHVHGARYVCKKQTPVMIITHMSLYDRRYLYSSQTKATAAIRGKRKSRLCRGTSKYSPWLLRRELIIIIIIIIKVSRWQISTI